MADIMIREQNYTGVQKIAVPKSDGSGDAEFVVPDYNALKNQPAINGVTLEGDKTASELGLVAAQADAGLISDAERQQIRDNADAIDAIEAKIPNQASAQNQLADKDFVNSSINSSTAFFRGSFVSRAALLAVAWQTSDPSAPNYVSNNDYAYVQDDESQNDEAWRYIYVLEAGGQNNGWQPQFRVNESPLTAAQVAALNSGVTAEQLAEIESDIDTIEAALPQKVDKSAYNPDPATDAMTQPVGVDANGKLRTAPGGSTVIVDDELSDTSENPVQNKIITGGVRNLKSAITQLDKTYTATLPFTLVHDEYVVKGTGEFASYGGWSRTDYVDLSSVIDFTPNKASNYSAFYDGNKTYLKDVKFTANQKVDVPDGASYLCISNSTNGMNALVIACTKNGAIKEIQNQVDDLENLINSETFIYPIEIISNAYIGRNGSLTTGASGYVATPFLMLPFNEIQSFQIRGVVYGNACCAIYNADFEPLLVITENNVSQYGGEATGGLITLTIPYIVGMKYARLSARTASYSELTDLWTKGNTLAGAFKRISNIETDLQAIEGNISTTISNSKVLVIGDSISTDAYGSYPKWVTDLINTGFLPSDTTNSSQHATGFVARYNNEENDFITRLKSIQNPETYDLVIVFGGINDYIQNIPMGSESGTDYTVSFKPAVNEFFTYLIQNFTQARLCVLLPLRTYATWQNSAGEYQQAYGDYIKQVAKSYCLPVLNLTEDSGFCPYITEFRNAWTLTVGDVQDGVHPNEEYERRFLAPMIKHFLQGLM